MSNKSKEKPRENPKESDDFESVAVRLGCDDDKAAFEKKLGKIAKPKPKRAEKDI